MKQIIPATMLKDYFVGKANSYDDYISFRNTFGAQYGVTLAINHLFGLDASLGSYIVNLSTAKIELNNLRALCSPTKSSRFAVRLSRNFMAVFGQTHINAEILPSFIATIDALNNEK